MRSLLLTIILFGFSASAQANTANLLQNSGFECGDGGLNGKQQGVGRAWETICGGSHPELYSLDSRVKHSGKYSQRMTCEGYNYRWLESGGYCCEVRSGEEIKHPQSTELGFQAIAQTTSAGAIQPGRTYSCGVWVKIDGLTDSWEWFRLCIYWLDADGKFIGEVREDHETSKGNYGSHDWKRIEISATAPENAAYAKVYLHHHFVHGTVWYDDASLTETQPTNDEPERGKR